jgi:hypothetical protein
MIFLLNSLFYMHKTLWPSITWWVPYILQRIDVKAYFIWQLLTKLDLQSMRYFFEIINGHMIYSKNIIAQTFWMPMARKKSGQTFESLLPVNVHLFLTFDHKVFFNFRLLIFCLCIFLYNKIWLRSVSSIH